MKKNISQIKNPIELTLRCVVLSIILTVILAAANAYLALRLGLLASASIPAAIVSMGVLRLFKGATILENNAVQTAASAGEAVAGGIVYTIPALIILNYWHRFNYWDNFFIAFCGGVLGVLFSIPLRRVLVHDPGLRFPEGQAIAQVLQSSSEKIGLSDVFYGGLVGGIVELLQSGFKFFAASCQYWFSTTRTLFGFGMGFSATMVGAGYLIGFEMACSMLLGAFIAWGGVLPVVSYCFPASWTHGSLAEAGGMIWSNQLRYLGIGAMLFAGIWTFLELFKPFIRSIRTTMRQRDQSSDSYVMDRVERDMPLSIIFGLFFFTVVILFVFFRHLFPVAQIGFDHEMTYLVVLAAVFYVVIVGFLFSMMTAYFSGMVGVTASPGSSVVIAGILFAAWILLSLMTLYLPIPFSAEQINAAEAMVIMIASVVTGIAAIANDNSQDLKVGQLIGATPWKQQVMLLLGVFVSACVIPPVMQHLFDVYGIAGVMPHAGMDVHQSLPAPVAALLAAITTAMFHRDLPWGMMGVGAMIILMVIGTNRWMYAKWQSRLSILGVAMGMYLPMSTTFPLFLGGMMAFIADKGLFRRRVLQPRSLTSSQRQIGTRIACGMLAGAALMDVALTIPFSIAHSPDAWRLFSFRWEETGGVFLSSIVMLLIGIWIVNRVRE